MSVNGLDGLLTEKNLLRTGKIDTELTNCGLGIDASVYLRQLYSRKAIKESLSSAIGGIPASLTREVEKDLAMFKKQNVNLLFVFDGLDLYNFNHKDDRSWRNEDFVSKRKAAWEEWTRLSEKTRSADAKGREESLSHAREAFQGVTSQTPNVDRYLMDILAKHNIEYIVAPLSAKAQLAWYGYISEKNYFDVAYSDSDILLYPVDRVIVGMDFAAGTFNWLFKDDIREYKQPSLGSEDNFNETFMDVCLLAGGVYNCPIFPGLAGSRDSMGPVFAFERAVDLLRTYGRAIDVVRELSPDATEYIDRFAKTKAILTYMPIMNERASVETLSQKSVPHNIAVVVTPRLANEIYYYLSRRLVGPDLYNLLMSESLKVPAPLDGGESQEYRQLLNNMVALRMACLSLLSGHSNRFFHQRHLIANYYDQPDAKVELPPYHVFNIADSLYGRTKSWKVPKKTITAVSKSNDMRGYVLALRGDGAKRTIKSEEQPLVSLEEIYANAWWRSLQARKFVNEDHSLSTWGIGLAAGLEKLAGHPDLYESLYLALELVRFKVLKHSDFSIKYKEEPMRGTDADKPHIRYISLLACLTSLNETPSPWIAPIDQLFLAFNSMIMEVSRNLRNLFEMTVLAMCVHGEVDRVGRKASDWTKLGLMLPFGTELNTGLAILTRFRLGEMIAEKAGETIATNEKEMFLFDDSIVKPSTEFGKVCLLWDAFVVAVKSAEEAGATAGTTLLEETKLTDELNKVLETDKWFKDLRKNKKVKKYQKKSEKKAIKKQEELAEAVKMRAELETAAQEDQMAAAEALIMMVGATETVILEDYYSAEYESRVTPYGYMEGLGYLPMTWDDLKDAHIVESLLDLHAECNGVLTAGISFARYHHRKWVVEILGSPDFIKIDLLGIMDPEFSLPQDMARLLDFSMYP